MISPVVEIYVTMCVHVDIFYAVSNNESVLYRRRLSDDFTEQLVLEASIFLYVSVTLGGTVSSASAL